MTDVDFYLKQNDWSKIYFRKVNQTDFDKVGWVEKNTNRPILKILELGAGGGQFSEQVPLHQAMTYTVKLVHKR